MVVVCELCFKTASLKAKIDLREKMPFPDDAEMSSPPPEGIPVPKRPSKPTTAPPVTTTKHKLYNPVVAPESRLPMGFNVSSNLLPIGYKLAVV